MATTTTKVIRKCDEIVAAKPDYVKGASSKEKCDCIGMVKYSLRVNGVTLTTTGTNWTMRNQVENVRKITGTSVLRIGDVVFKSRAPGESGYSLPSKYQKGGSAYNGDLNDYCHIGVVKSVKPLQIIHMTGPTAKTDTSIGKWKWAADLKKQYISDSKPAPSPTPTPDPDPEPAPYTDTAYVVAEKGNWVKMRAQPSTSCKLYDEVPVGAKVTVVTKGNDWTRISYGSRKGWYMMTKFLSTEKVVG